MGDYVEKGANHGRKFFQKLPNKGGRPWHVLICWAVWMSADGFAGVPFRLAKGRAVGVDV